MAVSFRSASNKISDANVVKANAMVQIAINNALTFDAPKYNKLKFKQAVDYALSLTKNHEDFYPLIKNAFLEAGVIFVILPNLPGSKINGATKKLEKNVMLMVNDRRLNSDTFWLRYSMKLVILFMVIMVFHLKKRVERKEEIADEYAADSLIDPMSTKDLSKIRYSVWEP